MKPNRTQGLGVGESYQNQTMTPLLRLMYEQGKSPILAQEDKINQGEPQGKATR